MVEIKIGEKKYYFSLSIERMIELNQKYENNLSGHIKRAVSDRDSGDCLSIFKNILAYSFRGTFESWYTFNLSRHIDVVIDNVLENDTPYVKFINGIMPDKRYRIIKFEFKEPPVSNYYCRCEMFTPRHSGRYPWDQEKAIKTSNKEEKSMNTLVQITKIVTHNNKVTIVYFSDGTFTKAICSEKDTYDLDVGIQVCIMKKMLGEKRYFKTMKYVHELIEKQEQDKKDAVELKRKRREEQKKREEKNRKLRQQAVDQWKSDITDAVKAAIAGKEDDLK